MNTNQFSFTTTSAAIPVSAPGGQTLIGIQNDAASTLTVKGRLTGNSNWAILGTVDANTIKGIDIVPGMTDIQLSGTGSFTGTVTG